MIYTCSYKNFNSMFLKGISISDDKGEKANYNKHYYKKLAPKKDFWNTWHNNIGKINEEINNKFYIEEYYKQVLSKLNPEEVSKDLSNSILLCFEENNKFCHRHIVAAWLELYLDIKVNEVKVDGLYIEILEKDDNIKNILEEVIKRHINMRGFNSIRAQYLFELGEKLENEANKLEKRSNKSYDYLRQGACYMRCEADYIESEYNEKKLMKKQ